MINEKYIGTKTIYLNIQLLRMILSFNILLLHYCSIYDMHSKESDLLINPTAFYLATFFIISFYFSYHIFLSKNIEKIKQRFIRIMVSFFFWPIISFMFNNSQYFFLRNTKKIEFKYLIYQIIIGNGFYCLFWFQFNLMFVSIIFVIIIFLFNKRYLIIFQIIGIVCYIFLCSNYYENINSNYSEVITFSIRRLPDTFIYSLTGFYLSSIRFIDIIKKHKKKALCFSFIILYSIKNYEIIFKNHPHLRYFIIELGALCIFTLFSVLPFDETKNINLRNSIKFITNFTGGIFYIHPKIIKWTTISIFQRIHNKILLSSISNYFVCFFICFFCSKLFSKTFLKYLFI